MYKRILTKEDFDRNPELADHGLKPGDEIEIPEEKESNENIVQPSDDDTGGSNPPPNKERP